MEISTGIYDSDEEYEDDLMEFARLAPAEHVDFWHGNTEDLLRLAEPRIAHNPLGKRLEDVLLPDPEKTSQQLTWYLSQEYVESLSEDWFDIRKEKITATNAAFALGHDPYNKQDFEEFYAKKMGTYKYSYWSQKNMDHGRKTEPAAGAAYARRRGVVCFEGWLVIHPLSAYRCIAATPDLVTEEGKVVEIKCHNPKPRTDGRTPPIVEKIRRTRCQADLLREFPHYYDQVQQQLFVTDMEFADFVQYVGPELNRGKEILNIVPVRRDRRWEKRYVSRLVTFWERYMRERALRGDLGPKTEMEPYPEPATFPVRLAIVGSRNLDDSDIFHRGVSKAVELWGTPCEVVSGGALGADAMGERWAQQNGIPVRVFKPDWNLYGMKAGPIRNQLLVDRSTHVLAFPSREGKGTQDAVRRARKKGLPVVEMWID